jgi:hypothetical protein
LPPDPAVAAAAAAAAPPLAPGRRPLDPKSKPTFLGDNFHGSPRHLKKLAINGLHLVTEHQNSHIFLTATVNKKWPELSEVIWDDMDPFDVPAIVGIVFQARLQALLHNLKNGKYFGGDKTVFIIHVIEYQERGFPHAHIVCNSNELAETSKRISNG